MTIETINGITYTSQDFEIKGNTFSIMVVTGRVNYVNVLKKTNNPFKTLGKQYKDFTEAAAAYKSPEMKTALLMAEMNLTQTK